MSDLPPPNKSEPSLYEWAGEACTVFINGTISGFAGGTVTGGTTTGFVAMQGERNQDVLMLYAAVGFVAAALGNGFKRFFVWHDANPFPNVFKSLWRPRKPRSSNPDGTPDLQVKP